MSFRNFLAVALLLAFSVSTPIGAQVPSSPGKAAESTPPANPPEPTWLTVVPEFDVISFAMPATPRVLAFRQQGNSTFNYQAELGGIAYWITSTELKLARPNLNAIESWTRGSLEELSGLGRPGQEKPSVTYNGAVEQGGLSGGEASLRSRDGSYFARMRLFFHGNRMIAVRVFAGFPLDENRNVERFLGSMSLAVDGPARTALKPGTRELVVIPHDAVTIVDVP